MEDFEKKVRISEGMDVDQNGSNHHEIVSLLRQFLGVQQRRAEAYAKLKKGFTELGDSAYQQLCNEITLQFNDCSKQVLALESIFLSPSYSRNDLASIMRSVQVQEKQKLHLDRIKDRFPFIREEWSLQKKNKVLLQINS
ncbi:unnamed protein product [Lactuca virosa]|uniref:Uncharacterized protein n=1 Tax=Lactuca virosa TaxID=75947 RepID=A0AAU9NBL8_9ASTR|nr:unnamed protein product [Lactuca virosa]